jgi:hypothetical protein
MPPVLKPRGESSIVRRLPFFGNKMKIEASVLLGDRDEEVEVHGAQLSEFKQIVADLTLENKAMKGLIAKKL